MDIALGGRPSSEGLPLLVDSTGMGERSAKKWSGYRQRGLVETTMHCFKLPGQRVAARTFDRQKTEHKVRAAIINRFSQIGTPNTIRVK